MPDDAAPVGRTWPAHVYEVGREKVREYANAVGEHAAHFHDPAAAAQLGFGDVVAPPAFSAVFCAPAMGAVIFDPSVGLFDPAKGISSYRFVHKFQRFDWARPVVAGDVITTEVTLIKAEAHEDGRAVRAFESVSCDAKGAEVVRAQYEGVVPPLRPNTSGKPSARRGGPGDPLGSGERLPDLVVAPDRYLPVRYAGASGDFTPFHLDPAFAKSIGLPGVILHGLYSFAQLARAHIAPHGHDPRALKQLQGWFRKPAVPERELRVRVGRTEQPDGVLETQADIWQDDSLIIGDARGRLNPYRD